MVAFVLLERRATQPLVHPHTWKISSLVSSTTVMLGITGLLMAVVFLTSIFGQTALGYSPLESGLAFLPLAATLVLGTHLAAHGSAHLPARTIAAVGLAVVAGGALLLSRVEATSSYVGGLLPGLCLVGLGAGLVFAAVAGTAMNGIPVEHTGMASGFLMTGHEVGAALGVAVLSAVAGTAGKPHRGLRCRRRLRARLARHHRDRRRLRGAGRGVDARRQGRRRPHAHALINGLLALPTQRSRIRATTSRRRTLPIGLTGSSSMKTTRRGTL